MKPGRLSLASRCRRAGEYTGSMTPQARPGPGGVHAEHDASAGIALEDDLSRTVVFTILLRLLRPAADGVLLYRATSGAASTSSWQRCLAAVLGCGAVVSRRRWWLRIPASFSAPWGRPPFSSIKVVYYRWHERMDRE